MSDHVTADELAIVFVRPCTCANDGHFVNVIYISACADDIAVIGEQRYCLLFTLMKSFIVNCIETILKIGLHFSKLSLKKSNKTYCVCVWKWSMHVEISVRLGLCTKHFSHVVSLMQNVFVVYSFFR